MNWNNTNFDHVKKIKKNSMAGKGRLWDWFWLPLIKMSLVRTDRSNWREELHLLSVLSKTASCLLSLQVWCWTAEPPLFSNVFWNVTVCCDPLTHQEDEWKPFNKPLRRRSSFIILVAVQCLSWFSDGIDVDGIQDISASILCFCTTIGHHSHLLYVSITG